MTETREPAPLVAKFGDAATDHMVAGVPHARALGIEFIDVWKANAVMKLTYSEKLVGNPETGVLHGGAVTSLLDHVSGLAVFCTLEELTSIATLDLRIDYMRAAEPGKDVIARCHCFKVTRTIAFVRGTAHQGNEDDPVATCTAAFMMGSDAGRKAGANLKGGAA